MRYAVPDAQGDGASEDNDNAGDTGLHKLDEQPQQRRGTVVDAGNLGNPSGVGDVGVCRHGGGEAGEIG